MKAAVLAVFAVATAWSWQGTIASRLAREIFADALIQLNTIPPDKRDAQWHCSPPKLRMA